MSHPMLLAFSWRIIFDKQPTCVALVKKGVMLKDDGCVFCEADREDLQHFFLYVLYYCMLVA